MIAQGEALQGFLLRTGRSALATIFVVACVASLHTGPVWAAHYALIALWSLGFFALTPAITWAFFAVRRKWLGAALIVAKIFWVFLLFGALVVNVGGAPFWDLSGMAALAGVSTPLVVLVLRALASADRFRSGADEK